MHDLVFLLGALFAASCGRLAFAAESGPLLEGTAPLTLEGDLAEQMIAGVDRFLLTELENSIAKREAYWRRDTTSAEAYEKSVAPNRGRLAHLIGVREERVPFDDIELVTTVGRPALVGRGAGFEVFAIRWPALEGVDGEGLLLTPTGKAPTASVVVIGDCEQTPEHLAGLTDRIPKENQLARRLAESGCRVIVPTLMNRQSDLSVIAGGKRRSTATHREILYRAAYQMGRHLIGYEVQKVLAAVDWFSKDTAGQPIGVVGYGEGGLVALYAAAIDPRVNVAGVSGYFDSRQDLWREPIDRNVFGLLREFGDAELASLIAPRTLIIEACQAPELEIPAGKDSAPARIQTPDVESVRREVERARDLVEGLDPPPRIELVASSGGRGPFGSPSFLESIMRELSGQPLAPVGEAPTNLRPESGAEDRHARQFHELAAFSQRLVDEGPQARAAYFANVDRRSGIEAFEKSIEPYRQEFRDRVIGSFDSPKLAADPRSRLIYDEPEYRGYQVVIDVFPDVFLYGILLVPKDISVGAAAPVVVCQHGLEGRAEFTIEGDYTSYRGFAARLAKRGFVTFSPQHLYRGGDAFRTLQRKANPLGRSLFAVMVAQHEQLLDWLGAIDFVDADRIAFYGISYGGKSAMRIPAVVPGYCLSICSSDFSNWIWRTVSNRFENGYLAHSEYEIFEFGLGERFNYAELAALICPRPFMVESFHHSGLVEETARAEFARVELLYENLGIGDRIDTTYYPQFDPSLPYAERETFDFLQMHLDGAGAAAE